MMNNPRVSVLMAAYNAMPYLPAAVQSILDQTLTDFQFVIVDDGSTDGSAAYFDTLKDPRIHLIRQANAGLSAALNTGVEACTAPYIARMDADDISLPHRLAEQADYLDNRPSVGCVGSQVCPFGDRRVGAALHLPTTHDQIAMALLEGRHGIVHPSAMLRAEPLRKIGGYWPMRVVAEDYDMFLRLSEVTRLAATDTVLYHMRFHMGSLNGRGMKKMRRSVDYARDRTIRRRAGRPEMSFEEFVAVRQRAPWWRRAAEAIDAHSRAQYRASVSEQCGGRPLLGYARLAWAAALAPELTVRRVLRMAFPPHAGASATAEHGLSPAMEATP